MRTLDVDMEDFERVYVTVKMATVEVIERFEGISIHVLNEDGECVTETWATWGELMTDEESGE